MRGKPQHYFWEHFNFFFCWNFRINKQRESMSSKIASRCCLHHWMFVNLKQFLILRNTMMWWMFNYKKPSSHMMLRWDTMKLCWWTGIINKNQLSLWSNLKFFFNFLTAQHVMEWTVFSSLNQIRVLTKFHIDWWTNDRSTIRHDELT